MSVFHFRFFDVLQEKSALKVGTDALLLGALVSEFEQGQILDVGSGTGVISLMMAQRFPESMITAVEIDKESFEESIINFQNSPWAERLKGFHADIFDFDKDQLFDLIVSNPPFYTNSLLPESNRNILSKHASFSFGPFLSKLKSMLSPAGRIWLILPVNLINQLERHFEVLGLYVNKKIGVYGRPDKLTRVVISLSMNHCEYFEGNVTVRDVEGNYTTQYKELTNEFHDRKLM